MNLFTQNSPYYNLLKYLLFLLKHPVYVDCINSCVSCGKSILEDGLAVVNFCKIKLKTIFTQATGINPLNPELNPICYLLALLGAHHFLHVSRIRVKSLTFMLLMSYIYGAPILDVSRSHTTTQHSR